MKLFMAPLEESAETSDAHVHVVLTLNILNIEGCM
jgi:hypothetical protein